MITDVFFPYKKVKIEKFIFDELKRINYPENVAVLIDEILTEYLSNQNNDLRMEQAINSVSKSAEEIEGALKWLDKVLYCSNTLKFGINDSMVGRYEYDYELVDYKINAIYKSLDLTVNRKGDVYKYDLEDIKAIESNGDRIWIYSKKGTLLLNCKVDKEKFENLCIGFRTGHIELLEDIWVYEQYKNTDPLQYNIEKYLHDKKNYDLKINKMEFIDKAGVKVVFVSTLSKDDSDGDIVTFTSTSRSYEGKFHFSLKKNSLFIWDMHPVRDSVGIGTMAMKMMVEIAKQNGKQYIEGNLCPSDLNDPIHKSRLIHFYKKNGFEVKIDEFRIILSLTE